MPASVFFSESSMNLGGQELQLLQQAAGLIAMGWSARILCRPGSRTGEEARRRGIPVEPVPFRNAVHPASLRRVVTLVRQHRPVAVVCHSGHDANVCGLALHGAAALGLLRPRPRLLRMRPYQPGRAGAFGYNHLFDLTFTPSKALRRQLLPNPRIRPERVQVLPPGIDFDALQDAASAALAPAVDGALAGHTGPLLVHAAMLRPEKGHAFMLDVVRALLPRFPTLLYVAAGDGVLRQELRDRVNALGLQDHVLLAGLLQPVAPLLARADVLVMPSLYEPLGMSQIEALALGVPVVVSDVGGLPETVEDGVTGLVCPSPDRSGSLQRWTAALTQVLQEPARAAQMAGHGRAQVLQRYGKQANLQALLRGCGTS